MKNNMADADILERAKRFYKKHGCIRPGCFQCAAAFAKSELARQSGWVKIESEADLPPIFGYYLWQYSHTPRFNVQYFGREIGQDLDRAWFADAYIAWRRIESFQEADDEN